MVALKLETSQCSSFILSDLNFPPFFSSFSVNKQQKGTVDTKKAKEKKMFALKLIHSIKNIQADYQRITLPCPTNK